MKPSQAFTEQLRQSYFAFAKHQTFDYEPQGLYEPVRYAMENPGKGVRPTLLLLAHSLGAENCKKAIPAAYALELFHNFTLLHDDIMDGADLRRGKKSVYQAFGVPSAILSGDAMLIHAYGYLLKHYQGELAAQLLLTFQNMAVALCGGQQRDMDMEAGQDATYADYIEMIHGKTGVLITASLVMGAQIAELSPEMIRQISEAGDLAGRAFQIQDDLLDTFRTSEVTGKMDYGDIVRGKQSAPFLAALDVATPAKSSWLKNLYAADIEQRAQHIGEILELYESLNVEKILSDEVNALSKEVRFKLESLNVLENAREALLVMIDQLAMRAF